MRKKSSRSGMPEVADENRPPQFAPPREVPVPVPTPTREEILDDLDEQISALEDKRKELKLEIEKEEILEKVLSGEIDITAEQEKSLHTDCHTHEEVEEARDEGFQGIGEAWGYLREFGSHTAACLSGALVGEKRPHPLCTCGWNHVATEAERAAH